MRILVLTKMYPDAEDPSSGTFVRSRVEELARQGHSVFVLKVGYTRERRWGLRPIGASVGDSVRILGANGFRYPLVGGHALPYGAIARLAGRERIDILHVHGGNLAAQGRFIARLCGIPYAVTLHGSDIHGAAMKDPRYRARTFAALRAASAAIFVSDFLLGVAREMGYENGNSRVIHNGIDRALFRPAPETDRDSVGYVGHLTELKRAHLLPGIFERLDRTMPGLRFAVIGDGPLQSRIEDDIEARGLAGKVALTGTLGQDEVARLMRRMKVLVLPSLVESWGCVIKEAQASGVMVVGSRNGGIPEAVGLGGVCVAEAADLETAYADAIRKLMIDPIPSKVLYDACEGFDWSRTVAIEASALGEAVAARTGQLD